MKCPTCQHVMIVVEHQKIELDYCTNCKGVWFDSGELELLVQSEGLESSAIVLEDIAISPEVEASHQERKCPICSRRMKETAIGEPAIHIDVCRQGDGLWFDGGEVDQLLTQLEQRPSAKKHHKKIVSFLGEVFKAK